MYLPTEGLPGEAGVVSSGGRGDPRSMLRNLEATVLVVVVVVAARAGNLVEVTFEGYAMIVSSWLSDTTTDIWDKTHQNL